MHARQFPERSTPAPAPGPIRRWNAHLIDWKPLLLLAAGGIYAASYVARAVNAWYLSLGVLPALDFQYFVAGMFLLVPLALLGLAFEALRKWVAWERRQKSRRERTDVVLGIVFFGSCILFILGWLGVDLERFELALACVFGGTVTITFVDAIASAATTRLSRSARPLKRGFDREPMNVGCGDDFVEKVVIAQVGTIAGYI